MGSSNGVPTDGDTHLWVSIDNGYITRIEGSWWYAEETVWDNTNIVPLSVVFDNLESELFVDGLYTGHTFELSPEKYYGKSPRKIILSSLGADERQCSRRSDCN